MFSIQIVTAIQDSYQFKVQIFIKIPTKYREIEINVGRIECASLLFQ